MLNDHQHGRVHDPFHGHARELVSSLIPFMHKQKDEYKNQPRDPEEYRCLKLIMV